MKQLSSYKNKNAEQDIPISEDLDSLYARPDFLIRRVHQLASAAFVESCTGLDITPSQYAALFALRQQRSVSQNELGRLIALDRSTTSIVLKSLRERGLVDFCSDEMDKRKKFYRLTNAGRLLLVEAERRSNNASAALLAVLSERQGALFLKLLKELAKSDLGHSPA